LVKRKCQGVPSFTSGAYSQPQLPHFFGFNKRRSDWSGAHIGAVQLFNKGYILIGLQTSKELINQVTDIWGVQLQNEVYPYRELGP
jgi:hypothetical protein